MGALHDLIGDRYGRLKVIERAENASDGHAQWLCECDCEKRIVVTSQSLVCNKTRSCGCLRKENIKNINSLYRKKGGRKAYAEGV